MPVVGAGTANAEFEILTGMKLHYFGTGEYPYKTVLKEVENCESIASYLKSIGYVLDCNLHRDIILCSRKIYGIVENGLFEFV